MHGYAPKTDLILISRRLVLDVCLVIRHPPESPFCGVSVSMPFADEEDAFDTAVKREQARCASFAIERLHRDNQSADAGLLTRSKAHGGQSNPTPTFARWLNLRD